MKAGAPQLRSNPRANRQAKERRPVQIDLDRPISVSPGIVAETLQYARDKGNVQLRTEQYAWMRDQVAPLATAVEATYAYNLQGGTTERADAGMVGSYFASAIVQRLVAVEYDVDQIVRNVLTWEVIERGMVLADESGAQLDALVSVFGQEVADELSEVRHDAARAACVATLAVSLNPCVS